METRIRVECKDGSYGRSITYYPEYKVWFFWLSIMVYKTWRGNEYDWRKSEFYTLPEAQKCIDTFLKKRGKPTITTTYIKYP